MFRLQRPARRIALPITFAFVVLQGIAASPNAVYAAQGDCGQPVTTGAMPAAADCLFILNAGLGTATCTPECICDVTGEGTTSATDALLCLQFAVGQPVSLNCQCGPTTTTTMPMGDPTVSVDPSVSGDRIPGGTVMANAGIETSGGCTVHFNIYIDYLI